MMSSSPIPPDREPSCRISIQLQFPTEISVEPVVCNLVRLFDLDFNILTARITPRRDGEMTLQLLGRPEACEQGMAYLKGRGINVSYVDKRIWHDEDKCIDCGMCTALCPTRALCMDPVTRKLDFNRGACTACTLCIRVCPVRARQLDAAVDQDSSLNHSPS